MEERQRIVSPWLVQLHFRVAANSRAKAGSLTDLLHAAIAEETRADSNLVFAVDAARADQGFETSANSELVKLLEDLTTNTAGTVAFGTEAAQMAELGAEAVVLGPETFARRIVLASLCRCRNLRVA